MKTTPAKAQNIQQFLDILLQVLSVLEVLLRILGIDLSDLFGGDTN